MDATNFRVVERTVRAATRGDHELTRRTSGALARLLGGVRRSRWSEVAWSFSHLTATGFPVEFSWSSSSDGAVRYTCEVAGPEADPADRLHQARRLLRELSRHALPDDFFDGLRELQQPRDLSYGAWVGGRHHTARGDDFKLYAEVPDDDGAQVAAFLSRFFGGRALLPTRPVRLRMIGYALGGGRPEFYFRTGELEAWELGLLLDRCGLNRRLTEFLSFVETIYGCRLGERLPGSNFGFSIARPPDGEAGIFSLFTRADCVFGKDHTTRRAVLRLAAEQRWRGRDYAAMTAMPNGGDDCCAARHGMVAFVISQTGPPALQIGFAPPSYEIG